MLERVTLTTASIGSKISGFGFSISSNRPDAVYVNAFISKSFTSLFYFQWEDVIIVEAIEIGLKELVLNYAIFLKLSFSVFFSLFG